MESGEGADLFLLAEVPEFIFPPLHGLAVAAVLHLTNIMAGDTRCI
jgi:hypothetical protein